MVEVGKVEDTEDVDLDGQEHTGSTFKERIKSHKKITIFLFSEKNKYY